MWGEVRVEEVPSCDTAITWKSLSSGQDDGPHVWGIVGLNPFPWTDTFMFLEPEHASSR